VTRIAFDTNILAYAAGVVRIEADIPKVEAARTLIERLARNATLVAPTQALGELFVVLRRSGARPAEARAVIAEYVDAFETPASDARAVLAAADLAVDHGLQFWDALICTAAADARCAMLLSEDMQHGFVTRGMTIVDPLRDEPHPKLAAVLAAE
jgi:predicted nucleic acid-binding protein